MAALFFQWTYRQCNNYMPPFWRHNNKRTYLFSKIFKVISRLSIDSFLLTKNDDIIGTIMIFHGQFYANKGNNSVFLKITEKKLCHAHLHLLSNTNAKFELNQWRNVGQNCTLLCLELFLCLFIGKNVLIYNKISV